HAGNIPACSFIEPPNASPAPFQPIVPALLHSHSPSPPMDMPNMHPSEVLFQGTHAPAGIPVCDHYAGSEKLMRKSLALQQELG
ncbi:hypothetical protein, partial [Enterobacter sp. JH8]|uniref:hypothetical protein n=1 Tax=Enterobacter sp. JH8 TaxID=2923086 RepID=UPI00208FB0EC